MSSSFGFPSDLGIWCFDLHSTNRLSRNRARSFSDVTRLQASDLRESENSSGPFSGPLQDERTLFPLELRAVVTAWPALPESTQEAAPRIVAEAPQGGEVGSPA